MRRVSLRRGGWARSLSGSDVAQASLRVIGRKMLLLGGLYTMTAVVIFADE